MFQQESSLIFWDVNKYTLLIDYQLGTPVNVEFDFDKLWKMYQEKRSSEGMPYMDIMDVSLMHVHPPGHLYYSELDRQVMKGFYLAFGRPSPFYIVSFHNDDISNIDCDIKLYRYYKREDKIIDETFVEHYRQYIDDFYLVILKLLSYGNFMVESVGKIK